MTLTLTLTPEEITALHLSLIRGHIYACTMLDTLNVSRGRVDPKMLDQINTADVAKGKFVEAALRAGYRP